jgi:hypothetical protein
MQEVSIYPWARNRAENLYKGTCFENALLLELEEALLHFPDDKRFKLLDQASKAGKQHPQDVLHGIFTDNLTLDFSFAKELKLYDIITFGCFIGKDELGLAMIELLEASEMLFILTERQYETVNKISLDFEVCNPDCKYSLFSELTGRNESKVK